MQCTDCSANARDVLAVVVTRWCNVDTRACIDLDGTLVDSLPDLRAGLNEMLRGLTRRELSADEVRRMTSCRFGNPMCGIFSPRSNSFAHRLTNR
jgi:phosphoglycolate phosphatase-like HAD superfamily hydrolase